MSTTYNFVTADTLNSLVATDSLILEVGASGTSVNIIGLSSPSTDNYTMTFDGDLLAGDVTILDGVVANHAGVALTDAPVTVKLTGPEEVDGKPLFAMTPASRGYTTFITSNADDVTDPANPIRGGGNQILVSFNALESGTKSVYLDFAEPVELHDGEVHWTPGAFDFDCHFSLGVDCYATPVTAVTPGTGNCILVPYYTFGNVIIPYPGGTHYVDMDDAVPVPSGHDNNRELQGYWDIVYDTCEVYASSTPGKAPYHLLDFQVHLWLMRNIAMGSPRSIFEIDIYLAEYIPTQWRVEFEVYRPPGLAVAGKCGGFLMCFRKSIT